MAASTQTLETATVDQLKSTFGIGSNSAKRIVRFRDGNDNKLTVADLSNIPSLRTGVIDQITAAFEKPVKVKLTKSKVLLEAIGQPADLELQIPTAELGDIDSVEIRFDNKELLDSCGNPLDTVVLKRRLWKGNCDVLSFIVPISSHTAAKTYATNVSVGTVTFSAILDVLEELNITANPSPLQVLSSERTTTRGVVLKNTGNVDLTITAPGAIVMEIGMLECRAIRGTVATLVKEDKGNEKIKLDTFIGAATAELSSLYTEGGIAKVTLRENDFVLKAGEERKVALGIELPSTIKNNNYTGIVQFYNSNITLRVLRV
jgi:hypothetical protein